MRRNRIAVSLIIVVAAFVGACSVFESEPFEYHDFKIIAHRGFWKAPNSAENSIEGLIAANEIGIEGTSIDICCTSDDSIVVAHGPKYDGLLISDNSFAKLREIRLSNGELLPTLNEYLHIADSIDTRLQLFIEIKHKGIEKRVVDMVFSNNLSNQVVFTSYNLSSCRKVLKYDSSLSVGNHRGRLSPKELHQYGIAFMCYNIDILKVHPEWIQEAHDLGMRVVAGANNTDELRWLSLHRVDYIGSNDPLSALQYRENYNSQ